MTDHTEHCFICHKEIELGSTASSIHTGCMALLTPNAEVEKMLAIKDKEYAKEYVKMANQSISLLAAARKEGKSAWTTKDAQAYHDGCEDTLKEAIEEVKRVAYENHPLVIAICDALQSKLARKRRNLSPKTLA